MNGTRPTWNATNNRGFPCCCVFRIERFVGGSTEPAGAPTAAAVNRFAEALVDGQLDGQFRFTAVAGARVVAGFVALPRVAGGPLVAIGRFGQFNRQSRLRTAR